MIDLLESVFASDGFMPHGHCYLWNSKLVLLHLISDGLIALAYTSIPITLLYVVRRRKDVPFSWMFSLFGLFIISCGATHYMEIWTVWNPTYWLAGWIKALTAVSSLGTAVLLVRLVPEALELPSPDELLKAKESLEVAVAERTAELRRANEQLQVELLERKRAEEGLRASQVNLAAAQRVAHIGSWELALTNLENPNENPLYWSDEMFRIFGYAPGQVEASRETFFRAVHPNDRQPVATAVAESIKQRKQYSIEHRILLPDGTERIVFEQADILCDEKTGQALKMVGVTQDITERRALAEQLRQSQRMEAIGRLAGGVAHDFNNLLTAIIGHSELLLSRLTSRDPMCEELKEIATAGQRAAALTAQLLAFSRKQVLMPQVLDLNVLVADNGKMLRRLIGEDIELVTRLESGLGLALVDPGQMGQVIMNLAVNARDAMPKGGKLTIETANVELDEAYARKHVAVTPGRYVMLAVSDTGVGMDAQTQSRLFEPFFTTKEQGQGTGLGLSTVYGIVKQSGGNIWVYSELGQGSVFKIYLPRVEEIADRSEEIKSVSSQELRGTETILLVEDEEAVRNLVRSILERGGYSVLQASNGMEAMELVSRHTGRVHLLLTDVVVPKMSGRELAERVTASRPETRVLYMSGYTDNAIVHHGVLDAGLAFLQKPFRPEALLSKVREVLDASKS
jgi:two-component system cell cycle sensor histidine kinase/response regulator CckA